MSLSGKLSIGFGTISGVALILAVVSVVSLTGLKDVLDEVIGRDARKVELSGRVESLTAEVLRLENAIVFRLMSQDAAGADKYKGRSGEALQRLGGTIDELQPLGSDANERAMLDRLTETYRSWSALHQAMLQALGAQQYDEVQKILGERITPAGERISSTASEYTGVVRSALGSSKVNAGKRVGISMWISVGLGLIVLIAAGIARWLVRDVNRVLRRVASDMGAHSHEVAESARQVQNASHSLAQTATDQAASLEETSASSQEVSAISRQLAASSAGAADRMQETGKLARGVGGSLDEMMTAMNGILESSQKISKIIKVIDEIAFQTNILALNAAVEAARAGEAGMGFAVVADEVRNLARRSATAASETTSLIEESMARSADGNQKVQSVAGALRTITQNSLQVESAVQEVRNGTQQQVTGMDQIVAALSRIQRVTEATAAHAEQSSSAGQEMTAQAVAMNQAVSAMVELVGGSLKG